MSRRGPLSRKRIHAAAIAALKPPALVEQYAEVSAIAATPQDYAAFIAAEQAQWSRIVQAIGCKE